MDKHYLRYLLKRFFFIFALLVGFSLLPGPRSLLDRATSYLLSTNSLDSMWAGLHLSLIHFCWLLGFQMPRLTYPENVDSQLAAVAFLLSVILQVVIAIALYFGYRIAFVWYDDDAADAASE